MNQHKYDQVKHTIEDLIKLNAALSFCNLNDRVDEAANLLRYAQRSAVLVEKNLQARESVEAEKSEQKLLDLLQQYCEDIKRLEEKFTQINRQKSLIQNEIDAISNISKEIMECLINDVTSKREIVFLPYKASMWDSLESVWKRANDNPQIIARVIPIPYFDKNPDGSMGMYHYEGELFPEDVNIIPFQEYDLEDNCPDEIYIHNPYDEYNYVTSVHPEYYSDKLKRYTDKLVYIPYFVLQELKPNSMLAKNYYHFAQTKGVLNADQVIVQSEDMRQIYIDALCQWRGESTRSLWESKILGTGSPKFEKLANLKKSKLDIPEEWKKYLFKADGSWKKVIFYNTSVSAFLEGKDMMIAKIENTFKVFEKHKGEVALLWRPHPLMEATISSMHPELWSEYQELVKRYKEDNIGIYDDSPDLDRAVVLADAYFGDGSSVVQLCQKLNKPIMLQNVEILN